MSGTWVIKILFISFLSVCVSCSNRGKVLNHEEYPDFSEMKSKEVNPPIDVTITMCTSKAHGPNYHIVEIKQMKFIPAELSLKKGDTVCWVNKDITNHDVTEETKKIWNSPPLTIGQSWTKVISVSAEYYCSIHLVMKGKLKVE
jgi:plastocyanin